MFNSILRFFGIKTKAEKEAEQAELKRRVLASSRKASDSVKNQSTSAAIGSYTTPRASYNAPVRSNQITSSTHVHNDNLLNDLIIADMILSDDYIPAYDTPNEVYFDGNSLDAQDDLRYNDYPESVKESTNDTIQSNEPEVSHVYGNSPDWGAQDNTPTYEPAPSNDWTPTYEPSTPTYEPSPSCDYTPSSSYEPTSDYGSSSSDSVSSNDW